MVDGETLIDPPIIPDVDLIHFNVLFAHLFRILTECQAMTLFQINTAKHNTITALLDRTFPPTRIAASANKPTIYVTPKTVGYIHDSSSTASRPTTPKAHWHTPAHCGTRSWR